MSLLVLNAISARTYTYIYICTYAEEISWVHIGLWDFAIIVAYLSSLSCNVESNRNIKRYRACSNLWDMIKVDSSSASGKFSSGSYDAQISIIRYFDSLNSADIDLLIVDWFLLHIEAAVSWAWTVNIKSGYR